MASWAGICPGNHESAGRSKGGKRRKGNVYLRRILCEIAHAAACTHGVQFGPYKQHLAKRRGAGRAVVATAHKILRIVFSMLRDGKPYCDPQIDYQARTAIKNRARWLKMLRRANLLQDVVGRKPAEQRPGAATGGRDGPLSGTPPEPLPASAAAVVACTEQSARERVSTRTEPADRRPHGPEHTPQPTRRTQRRVE